MDEQVIQSLVNGGSAAVVALAFYRGLTVVEKVLYRLLDTIETLCRPCEESKKDGA